MMNRIILILLILLSAYPVYGQSSDHIFSGDFDQVSFDSFVEYIESTSGLTFYYLSEWTSGVSITAGGTNLSLATVLEQNLESHRLSFYIDGSNNVFIIPGTIITLSDIQKETEGSMQEPGPDVFYLSKEEEYFGKRKEKVIETVTIGERNGAINGPVTLYGKIWDRENGQSLIGATIYFPETKTGTVTDIDGRYQIVLSPGSYLVVINCLGMSEIRYNLNIYADGRLDIGMEGEIIPINEVTIKAEKYQNVSGIQMGFARLDIKTIKEIPLVMGEKDLLKVAQMLPGIQSVGEGSSGFNVRGSSADQNMFYINKIPVYNTAHLFGFFSSFSPDIIKDFSLYKSNIPVEYGGRIASIFSISTREGNKNRFTGRGGISPVTGHIALEGPLKKEKHSFVLSTRSTYSDWILTRLKDPALRNSRASFYDLSAGVSLEPNEKNLIKIFGYYASDKFKYEDVLSYDYNNTGASINWRHRISPALNTDLAAVFGNYSFSTINEEYLTSAYEHHYQIGHYEIKSDFSWVPFRKHVITFGGSIIYYDLDRGKVNPYGVESNREPVDLGQDSGLESAIYLGDKYEVLPGLTLYGGLRYTVFNNIGPAEIYHYFPGAPKNPENIIDTVLYNPGSFVNTYTGPDIRVAVNYQTGSNSSVKLSYNRIRQHLFLLSNTIAIAPTDQWKLCDYHIRPPVCDQLAAGFYKDFPDGGVRSSAEIYLKKVHNVIEYKDGASFIASEHTEEDILQGRQNAYGFELMLEKEKGKVNGWISYTWSRSVIQVDGKNPWEDINNGLSYPANYDRPHAVNLILNYRLNRRLSFSGNLVYNTGRPVTYPISVYYMNDQEVVNFSARNAYRLPDYFRADLSINLEGNLRSRKPIHSYWMINFYNLTGRKNAYSVYFRSEDGRINGYKLSVFGTSIITLSWNFKFGNYASE
ncbi:MAG: hypothetical protein AMS27_10670 [Bacteroides sp. SM23_62_1]|nr:MAG: hypothetical protein AMS27_10670 [Bacteroides sp. SM23_62_1]